MAYTEAQVDAIIEALIIDNNTMQVSPAKVREVCKAINSRVPTGDPSGVSAVLPLIFDEFTNTFTIQQSSGTTDGFLSATDWLRFNRGGVANKYNEIKLKQKGMYDGTPNDGPGIEIGDLCFGWISDGNFGETLQYLGGGDQDIENYEIILASGTVNLP